MPDAVASQRRRMLGVAVVAFAIATLLAGCSSSTGPHVAKIGVIAPLDHGLVQFGRGIRNSVQLAVNEANRRGVAQGWKFTVDAVDDSSDASKGEAAARRLASDPAVIGVVGTYNSGVAARAAPVLDRAGIVMISPANTNPTLTKGDDPTHPVRPHANYFRMVATDDVQGPFLAKAAFDDAGARRAAVVSETKPVSKGLADAFSAAFTGLGGSVVYGEVVPDGTSSFDGEVPSIAAEKPDIVFYGGEYDGGAAFSAQVAGAGITAPIVGGDGIKDDAYIAKAGPAADGDLASTVGAPLASLESAATYSESYRAAGFADPPSDYGVYAYDAGNTIISAAAQPLAHSSKVSAQVRSAVVTAVQATDTTGASGQVAFDAFGDTRNRILTLYRVANGTWTVVKTVSP
jgi:branched-chain amino acid transport system substrate-binding protein